MLKKLWNTLTYYILMPILVSVILGLGAWCFSINADVSVLNSTAATNAERIKQGDESLSNRIDEIRADVKTLLRIHLRDTANREISK